jgi:hypothetical protein
MAFTTVDYANAVLDTLGDPHTQSNIDFLVRLANREGGTKGGKNNPWNTKQRTVTIKTSTGTVSAVADGVLPNGISTFASADAGAIAGAGTILNGNYPNIVAALKAGNATQVDQAGGFAHDLSKWSNGAYITIANVGLTPWVVDKGASSYAMQSGVATDIFPKVPDKLPNPFSGVFGDFVKWFGDIFPQFAKIGLGILLVLIGVVILINGEKSALVKGLVP